MKKTFRGECPHVKGIQSIQVEYEHIPMVQTLSRNYKRTRFNCSRYDECPHANTCPVYENAPKSITE